MDSTFLYCIDLDMGWVKMDWWRNTGTTDTTGGRR
jgi:hypothetical protein